MLWFERRVVDALTRDTEEPYRTQVIAYVEASLRSMPEYLRAGIAAESILFGAAARARGDLGDEALHRLLSTLESAPLDAIRQYPRLFTSLVLLAREELVPDAAQATR